MSSFKIPTTKKTLLPAKPHPTEPHTHTNTPESSIGIGVSISRRFVDPVHVHLQPVLVDVVHAQPDAVCGLGVEQHVAHGLGVGGGQEQVEGLVCKRGEQGCLEVRDLDGCHAG